MRCIGPAQLKQPKVAIFPLYGVGQMEVVDEHVSRWYLYKSPPSPGAEWLASCPVTITGAGPSALPSPPAT